MTDEQIQQLKKIYLKTEAPEYLINQGWEDLSLRLPKQEFPKPPVFRYSFLFALFLIFALGGTVAAAQNANQGSFLYPVKAVSNSVIESFSQSIGQKKAPVPTPGIQEKIIVPSPAQTKETEKDEIKVSPTGKNNKQEDHRESPTPDQPENKSEKSNDNRKEIKGVKTEVNNDIAENEKEIENIIKNKDKKSDHEIDGRNENANNQNNKNFKPVK